MGNQTVHGHEQVGRYGQLPGAGRVAHDNQMKRLNVRKKLDVIG